MPHKDYRYGIHPVDQAELEDALKLIRSFSERTTRLRQEIAAKVSTLRGKSACISFIEANAISIQTTGPSAAIAPADLADKAKSFAVFVECQR